MKHFQFVCTDLAMLKAAMEELTERGLAHIYTLEDHALGGTVVGGFAKTCPSLPGYLLLHTEEEAAVDWNAQWHTFSPYATLEGHIECSLKAFGGPATLLKLFPGGGFGDLSHPTTQLMLQMLCETPLSFVVDIGCGSGVLSCAAALLGAEKVYGYDIDPIAVAHAEKNTLLNGVQGNVKVGTAPLPVLSTGTLLLNMTLAEQKIATAQLTTTNCTWLISGIHDENVAAFSTFAQELGLTLEKEYSLDQWNSYIGVQKKPG